MIKSMTGFGRSEYCDGKRNIVVEIKSVNHRYSDITVKMPRRYSFAEEGLKAIVKEVARRGKVEVSISIENLTGDDMDIRLNTLAASQYYENLKELKKRFSLSDDITLSLLASLPDVMKGVPDIEGEDTIFKSISLPAREAAARFDEMRKIEGEKLAQDILMRKQLIQAMCEAISNQASESVANYRTRLNERINELLDGSFEISEERMALEVALFADKSSITEELVRLNSHISQLEKIIIKSTQPEGKKLDFLVQEMNREVNTIGSKANDVEITNYVIEIKSEIEKIREQIQNVE